MHTRDKWKEFLSTRIVSLGKRSARKDFGRSTKQFGEVHVVHVYVGRRFGADGAVWLALGNTTTWLALGNTTTWLALGNTTTWLALGNTTTGLALGNTTIWVSFRQHNYLVSFMQHNYLG